MPTEPLLIDLCLATASPERVSQYIRLFAVVATLLGAFMLGIMLIGYLRRRRLARSERLGQRGPQSEETIPDAWTESGRRDAPYAGTRPGGSGADDDTRSGD